MNLLQDIQTIQPKPGLKPAVEAEPVKESLIKELAVINKPAGLNVDLKNSDATDAGSRDVQNKARDDISFSLMRNTINTDGNVTGSDVANYIERAEELNDEVDTIPYGLETDDGKIVKVYVNAEQADKFEEAMKKMLGLEDDIEEAINRLATEYDIVDVVWPRSEDDEEEGLDDEDLEIDDTSMLDPEDDLDFSDDNFDVLASAEDEPADGGDDIAAAAAADEKEPKKKKAEEPADDEAAGGGGETEEEPAEDEEEELDADGNPVKKKKKKKKKEAQPPEPVEDEEPVKESKQERQVDSKSIAAAVKQMTSQGKHIKAMDEDDDAVYIEDDNGDEYVMRGDKKITKEKHGKKLSSYDKKDKVQEHMSYDFNSPYSSDDVHQVVSDGGSKKFGEGYIFYEGGKDQCRGWVDIHKDSPKYAGVKFKIKKVRRRKMRENQQENEMSTIGSRFLSRVLQEAAAEDKDGVKDGFNIPLDSQQRALAAKLKLPLAKRLVAFHAMVGIPGRYLNSEDAEGSIGAAADMLRKKVSVRRAFLSFYEAMATAKGLTIQQQNEGLNEAKGEYSSYAAWKKAVKKAYPEAWFDGDKDIANAMVGENPYKRGKTKGVGEWDGDWGWVEPLKEEKLSEASKQKRGSFIQKLFETVIVELGVPNKMVTTSGPAAVGTALYKTAELIEQSSDLERGLRLLATRLGIKSADANAAVNEAKKDDKEDHGVEVQGRKGMKSTPFTKKFKTQAAYEKWLEKNGDDVSIDRTRPLKECEEVEDDVDPRFSKLSALSERKVDEAVDVGNDDYAEAVMGIVAALGIPDAAFNQRQALVRRALREKKATLTSRARVITQIGRLQQILDSSTRQGGQPTQATQGTEK